MKTKKKPYKKPHRSRRNDPLIEMIKDIILDVCGETARRDEIFSNCSRDSDDVWIRQLAMYFCVVCEIRKSNETGRYFGFSDHTIALHSRNKVADLINSEGPKSRYLLQFKECKRRIEMFLAARSPYQEPVPVEPVPI